MSEWHPLILPDSSVIMIRPLLIVVLLLRLRDESAVEDGGRLEDELVEAEGVLAANDLAKFGEKGRLGK